MHACKCLRWTDAFGASTLHGAGWLNMPHLSSPHLHVNNHNMCVGSVSNLHSNKEGRSNQQFCSCHPLHLPRLHAHARYHLELHAHITVHFTKQASCLACLPACMQIYQRNLPGLFGILTSSVSYSDELFKEFRARNVFKVRATQYCS